MAAVAAALVACDKGFEKVTEPTLELSTPMTTYFTQEPVVFNIESNANFLSFYSGERGNDYAYAQQERIYEGEAFVSFNTAFQAGSQWKTQLEADPEKKSLRMFYSTDFSGVYTVEEVEKAVDIATNKDVLNSIFGKNFSIPLATTEEWLSAPYERGEKDDR